MIRTAPKARLIPVFEKFLIPNCVPIIAPIKTERAKSGIVFGIFEIEEIFPSKPETEFRKMKTAAVPDADLTAVHPKARIMGDRKIPPPVPVRPEMKPIIAPVINKRVTFGRTICKLVLEPSLKKKPSPAKININPRIVLNKFIGS